MDVDGREWALIDHLKDVVNRLVEHVDRPPPSVSRDAHRQRGVTDQIQGQDAVGITKRYC